MAQWVRAPRKATRLEDLGTLTSIYGRKAVRDMISRAEARARAQAARGTHSPSGSRFSDEAKGERNGGRNGNYAGDREDRK